MARRLLALTLLAALVPSAAIAATPKVVAKGIPFATNVVFDPAGGMWVTSGAGGENGSDGVWYVPKGGRPRHVVRHLTTALGLRWAGGKLYVSHITSPSNGRVTSFTGFDGKRFAKHTIALDGLRVGRHTMDSIVHGPDGRLYVGVGSTFDNHGRPGRVVSWVPGKHAPRLEATGLRNPYGLAFHGADLLVTDNGRDDLGETRPPEELDAFDPTGGVADFGFPGCFDQGGSRCQGKLAPIGTFPAHASTDGLAVKGDSRLRRPERLDDPQARRRQRRAARRLEPPGSGHASGSRRSNTTRSARRSAPTAALYVTLFLSGKVVRLNSDVFGRAGLGDVEALRGSHPSRAQRGRLGRSSRRLRRRTPIPSACASEITAATIVASCGSMPDRRRRTSGRS